VKKTVEEVLRAPVVIAPREQYVWCGFKVEKRFARRPVVHHREASQARGSGAGQAAPVTFLEGGQA
jgi:hypothetical protein